MTNAMAVSNRISISYVTGSLCGYMIALATFRGSEHAFLRRKMPVLAEIVPRKKRSRQIT